MTVCKCTYDNETEPSSIQTDTAHRNENDKEKHVPGDKLPNSYYLLWEDIQQFTCQQSHQLYSDEYG